MTLSLLGNILDPLTNLLDPFGLLDGLFGKDEEAKDDHAPVQPPYYDSVPVFDGRSAELNNLLLNSTAVGHLDGIVGGIQPNVNIRTVSGIGNNLNNPEFGAADQPFVRLTEAEYGEDGAPRGVWDGEQTLPNERDISNVIVNQDENGDGVEEATHSVHGTNLLLMSFGQFFDHGLDFIERSSNPDDKYYIPLREGDPLYSFSDDGNPRNDITSIRVTRGAEAINPATGDPYELRSHTNKTSPFTDQNQTYGSSDAVTFYLRETARDDNGDLMRDSDGNLVKTASLAHSEKDASGYWNLPTYRDILLNNGVSEAEIDAAVAANSFDMLMEADGFVDFRNVTNPYTGAPDGNPLLLDISFDADPEGPAFNLGKLLSHYVAGDGRANENTGLTPIHTIFHRDHEYWVEQICENGGADWSEDKLFETAKSIIESEYQRIIFDEFVDAMAGSCPARSRTASTGIIPVSTRRSPKNSPTRYIA